MARWSLQTRRLLLVGLILAVVAGTVACGSSSPSPPTPGSNSSVKADFMAEPTTGEGYTWVQFTDLSTGPVVSREWDFGDGSPKSDLKDPKKFYRYNGKYTVTLTVRGPESGDVDTVTKRDYIEITGCPT